MRLPNIHRLTFFSRPRKTIFMKGKPIDVGYDFWLTPNQCQGVFGFNPDGANFYVALTEQRLAQWTKGNPNSTLNDSHRVQFFEPVVNDLKHGNLDEATIILSLEPKEPITAQHKNPYDTVRRAYHQGYLTELARQLHSYRKQCTPKSLRIIIRYASEMNSNETIYSHKFIDDPSHFKETFRLIHQAFNEVSPDFVMNFSPAIRSDLTIGRIKDYFPGKDVVELVAGSWYCGDKDNFPEAKSQYLAYLKVMQLFMNGNASTPLVCAIDEIGGCDGATVLWKKGQASPKNSVDENVAITALVLEQGHHHNLVLAPMLAVIKGLAPTFRFDYVTLFLTGKWDPQCKVTEFLPIQNDPPVAFS